MSSDVENGYTFRMGDHEITMRDSFASMLDTTQLTDCLLVCHTHLKEGVTDGSKGAALTNGHSSPVPPVSRRTSVAAAIAAKPDQILRTHRVILSASSDYFRSVFSSVPNVLNNGVVAVIITNVDFDDLEAIIDFIYKGQVSVGQSRIHKFLAAAQLLMIKGLMNIKLVNNDDQPIDDNTFAENELIQRLKSDKRQLELEIKNTKDMEKSKIERMRRELSRDIESEMKKKFELEKSILFEEKQRFEAEKMKFTIEKEVYEKNKSIEMANKINKVTVNCVNSSANSTSNKQIVVNNSNKSILIDALNQNGDQNKTQNESNTTTRILRGTPSKPIGQQTPQKPESTKNSLPEPPTIEPEGRQLRKRIRLSDNNEEGKESTTTSDNHTTHEDEQQMDVEDEDGEVYEVDFSQPQDACQSTDGQPEPQQTVVNTTEDKGPEQKSSSSQTATILASAVGFHKAATPTPVTPSHQMPTRSLRRSTSSIGSASTQSISGENGTEGESISVRRKGPGRPAHWVKDEAMAAAVAQNNPTQESDSPITRAKLQKTAPQESTTPVTIAKQSPGPQLYTCPYCPQVYHGSQSMQDHINGVHLNQKTQYICDYCGKVYTWRISLNKHLRTVHPNEPIPE